MGNKCCGGKDERGLNTTSAKQSKNQKSEMGVQEASDGFQRRQTFAPNMKNFKNIKQIDDIAEYYKIGGVLGSGSFGTVYRAVRKGAEFECALKVIKKKDLAANSTLPQLMISELAVLQKSSHPNIMSVNEILEDDICFYIASELLDGGELFDRLIDVKNFSERKAAYILKQVLQAINYMHVKNICHRDLKPENILLESKDLNKLDIKISDFGFACFYDSEFGLNTVLGSALYMAPELIRRERYDEKVDIWAIGVISYMLLTGRNPFPGKSKDQVKQAIVQKVLDWQTPHLLALDPRAVDFIKMAMERDVDKRASAKQLLESKWLIEKAQEIESPVDFALQKDVLENLARFSKSNKFQKTIVSILAGLKADKTDLKMLTVVFKQIDKNNDGVVTIDEIKQAQSILEKHTELKVRGKWENMFKQADLDGDGRLDFHEFFAAAINHCKILTKENVRNLFKMFDSNNDGMITVQEFMEALPTNYRTTVQNIEGQGAQNKSVNTEQTTRSMSSESIAEIEREQRAFENQLKKDETKWIELITLVDQNNDGMVSYEEFEASINKFIEDAYSEI